MNVKHAFGLLGMFLLSVSLLTGCGNTISAKTEKVTKSPHPVALTLDANITALHSAEIMPKVSGKLVSAPPAVGQDIKAGEVIAQVDPTPYQQSLSSAEAELMSASASAAPVYEAPPVDTGERAKLDVWYQMGAISRVEYNQMQSRANGSGTYRAAPAVDTEKLAQLQQTIQTAREMLSNATIYSPIDGRVTAVAENSSVAVAGNVLATVQQLTPLVATFAVPQDYIDAVQAARAAGTLKVQVLTPGGETEAGELTFLSTEVDGATNAYLAKITFNNNKNLFVPGEFYHIRLSTPEEINQITVPKEAVKTKDSGDFVYVVNSDGVVDARAVLTGDEEGGRVIVLSGLKEGDTIVSDPPDSLEIGMKVSS
ncbi:efflux RND transporter periplasmic adaptor subunit [Anaeroglobus sp. AF13-6AC]|uniref:efflux RND transporter periplasmic adaptor subunit n=1 Tax=Anaeroglobus sp. AF13-6AC TaxID=2997918 RepID=UPI0022E0AEAE|nr:efflux RND transporter periplasmic adaptor subunit [Anaeroglobus sp. AF13-6AC]